MCITGKVGGDKSVACRSIETIMGIYVYMFRSAKDINVAAGALLKIISL